MIFAAFGACGRNMPPYEYAEKKEGWQEPGIFRNSPTPSFRKRP